MQRKLFSFRWLASYGLILKSLNNNSSSELSIVLLSVFVRTVWLAAHRIFRQELRRDLGGYDFVTPTGEPLGPLLEPLMGENLDPETVASMCEDIEGKQFACLGGPLRNSPWIELRR